MMTEHSMPPRITLVFTDIVGSTELTVKYGKEYHDALEIHNALLREILTRWQGTEIHTAGDSFFVTFANAANAIQWATEAQQALRRRQWPAGIPLQVRIGMHTGAPRLLYHPNNVLDYVGAPVNLAARVGGVTQGQQILTSEATREAARAELPPDFTWYDWDFCSLKGIGRERLWQVCHSELAPPEGFSPPVATALPAASHRNSNLPFGPNPHFIGRDALLEEIYDRLHTTRRQPVALVGMSGMGKTQIAIEYAHAYLADYPEGVFWLNARDSQRLLEDFASIGRRYFGLPDSLSVQECAEQTRSELSRLTYPALLIFDNVTDDSYLALLPVTGRSHLLLTTQRMVLPENIHIIEPKPLDAQAALTLLQTQRRAVTAQEKTAAGDIAAMVGCLPLALSLSAHHIKALGCSFTDYRERLAQDPHETLRRAAERFCAATGHDGNIYYVLHRVCEGLSADAERIMIVASCFAPRGISTKLLFAASGIASPLHFDDALAALWSQCLINYETDEARLEADEPAQERRLSVHELVQAYFSQRFKRRLPKARARTVHVLTECLSGINAAMNWPAARLEIGHCNFAAALCRKQRKESRAVIPGLERLLYEIGAYLFEQRDLRAAQQHYAEGYGLASERQGPESLLCTHFLRGLGEVYQESGETTTALKHSRLALRLARRRLAKDAPMLAVYYNSLGYVLRKQDRSQRAMRFYSRALHIYTQAYGERHPDVAMCLNNIGAALEQQGDWNTALTYFHRALDIDIVVSGPRHVTTAMRYNNIGRVHGRRGEWRQALQCHRQALTIYESVYAERHTDVGASLIYIAEALHGLGQGNEAATLYQQAYSIYAHYYGPTHPACVYTNSRLESLRAETEQYTTAR